jgi:hypothetical protein
MTGSLPLGSQGRPLSNYVFSHQRILRTLQLYGWHIVHVESQHLNLNFLGRSDLVAPANYMIVLLSSSCTFTAVAGSVATFVNSDFARRSQG